jgi:hypothetical protein
MSKVSRWLVRFSFNPAPSSTWLVLRVVRQMALAFVAAKGKAHRLDGMYHLLSLLFTNIIVFYQERHNCLCLPKCKLFPCFFNWLF